MNLSEIRLRRLNNQHLIDTQCASPAEVVRWLGAVQGQEFPVSLWAIGQRVPGATEQGVEQAIADRTIVRTWPMRGTVHYVPAEDTCWMVQLMAPRVIQKYRSIYQKVGINEAIIDRSREIFVRALEGGRQRTRRELYQLLHAEGIETTNNRGGHIVGQLAQQGLICITERQGKHPTVALLDEFVPNGRALSREEALAEIALRYFRSHGPATVRDFSWWTGLTAADARTGLEAVKGLLVEETVEKQVYWWMDLPLRRREPEGTLHLLSDFDEYLVAYKDRGAALDPRYGWLLDPNTHLGPVLIIDGIVTGTWKKTVSGGGLVMKITLARALTGDEPDRLEAEIRRYAEFLGMPAAPAQMEVRE